MEISFAILGNYNDDKIKQYVTTIFGIKNCDTVKKARKWLEQNHIDYIFHDVRSDGLSLSQIEQWISATGWETVLNRRGTTWRGLDSKTQEQVSADNVAQLLLDNPAMIKRPVLEQHGAITVGFKPDIYEALFNPDLN